MPKKPTSQETIQKIRELHAKGLSYDAILKDPAVHAGKQTVMKVVKEMEAEKVRPLSSFGGNTQIPSKMEKTQEPKASLSTISESTPEWSEADWNSLDKLIESFTKAETGKFWDAFYSAKVWAKPRKFLDELKAKVDAHYHRK